MSVHLGIDIGGTCVKAAAIRDGRVIGVAESSHYARPSVDQVRTSIEQAMHGMTTPGESMVPASIGCCVPGRVRAGVVEQSVNVPDLVGVKVVELVASVGGGAREVPIELFADVHAATYDVWCDEGGPLGRLAGVSLGTGVGLCVLDDGEQLRVSGASSGHLGQVDVSLSPDAPVGPDGGRGSLEAYIGLPALRVKYGDELAPGSPTLKTDDEPIRALVRALRIVHAIYRPHRIVLLGGVGTLLGELIGPIQDAVNNDLTGVAQDGWTLGVGRDGFHGARGAARLAPR